ncbi:hypothetical protein BC940DRAFT_88904 [Gongronella butleri]|nr:hypothetical protein BC940DRAFT_88904 [Gongronella butleri]
MQIQVEQKRRLIGATFHLFAFFIFFFLTLYFLSFPGSHSVPCFAIMASLFFEDYSFPVELYDRSSGAFTPHVQTLLDFAPSIMEQLPKDEKDQVPLQTSSTESIWTLPRWRFHVPEFLYSRHAIALGQTLFESAMGAIEDYKYEQRRESRRRRRQQRDDEESESQDDQDDITVDEKGKSKAKKQKTKSKEAENASTGMSTATKSTVALGALSFSLYSTYNANVALGDISFHDQLEILFSHVHSVTQSVDVWIKEHVQLGDPVPAMVQHDVDRIKALVHDLERLDPRRQKKLEATGWGIGALGSLSMVGGLAMGSNWALSSGAVAAIGGALITVGTAARSKSTTLATQITLTRKVQQTLTSLANDERERLAIIQSGFTLQVKQEETKTRVNRKSGDFLRTRLKSSSSSSEKHRQKSGILLADQ